MLYASYARGYKGGGANPPPPVSQTTGLQGAAGTIATHPATFAPDLFTPSDGAGVRKLVATLTPNPVRMPDFAARAMVRKLQANAWVVRRSMASMMSGVDLMDFRLHGIQEPTLIVWGSKDALIPLPVGETLHRDIPNSVLDVIEGCGHLAPAECSKPVIKGTVDFLKAEPPMQGGEKNFAAGH
mgnify:CR=1 FL=1